MLYVDAFPYLNYFLFPVILASVFPNSLEHSKSQLCRITLDNQRLGESASPRNNTCISITFLEF